MYYVHEGDSSAIMNTVIIMNVMEIYYQSQNRIYGPNARDNHM